jgi:predicted transcriptional regulator
MLQKNIKSNKIEQYLEENAIPITDLSKILGKSRSTLYEWFKDVSKHSLIYGAAKKIIEARNERAAKLLNVDKKHQFDMSDANFHGNTNVADKITYGESDIKEMVFDLTIQNKKLTEKIKDLEAELRKLKGE